LIFSSVSLGSPVSLRSLYMPRITSPLIQLRMTFVLLDFLVHHTFFMLSFCFAWNWIKSHLSVESAWRFYTDCFIYCPMCICVMLYVYPPYLCAMRYIYIYKFWFTLRAWYTGFQQIKGAINGETAEKIGLFCVHLALQ